MELAIRAGRTFKAQAAERGWLLTSITIACVFVGVMCVAIGALVAYIALMRGNVPVQQPVAMFAAGLLLLVATHSMWNYERWGRNVAVAVTFCMGWVAAEALCRRFGYGIECKIPVVVFGALALSYFTSPTGRFLFRKKDKEDPKEEAGGDAKEEKNEVVG